MTTRKWWAQNPPRPANLCCDDFWQAMQVRTDNEGYGSLISFWDGEFHIGGNLPSISVCPWCGSTPKPPARSAEGAGS